MSDFETHPIGTGERLKRLEDALLYGTLSMTEHMVVIDFEDRARAEAMFEALSTLRKDEDTPNDQ